jgi:drug/metabolite transporter (DMT)-like permease
MTQSNIRKAVPFCLCYGLFTSMMSLFVKLAAQTTSNSMVVFFRFTISLIYILIIIGIKILNKNNFSLKTEQPMMHVLRALSSFFCLSALFYSLKYISLMNANILFMTYPLFIPFLGMFLGWTKINKKNLMASVVGFLGVVLVLKPNEEIFNPASLIALASGVLASFSILGVHEIAKKDNVHTVIFYYFLITFIISLGVVSFNWETPTTYTLLLLCGVGIFGALSQEASVRALVYAPARIAAPLFYTTIIFSGILDWFLWGKTPNILTIFGVVIICIGNILVVSYANRET